MTLEEKVYLDYIKGFSVSQIAHKHDISQDRVERLIMQARKPKS